MFTVPSERYRMTVGPMASDPGINAGAFLIDSVENGWALLLICDDGLAPGLESRWEHVSLRAVTRRVPERSRVPTWREMVQVKDLCWSDDDVVIQIHPARRDYVNRHPHVLHLWRPLDVAVPVPPTILV